ncbi:MAG: dihydrodipicolinate reductase [Roseobacter sp.]
MRGFTTIFAALLVMAGTTAQAEFSKVNDADDFIELVAGKELRRPFVNIEVSQDGEITGQGAAWPVTGNWSWEGGYFCRDLFWGGDPLGYNCQRVDVRPDGRIRFTSDRGAGDAAEFRLR